MKASRCMYTKLLIHSFVSLNISTDYNSRDSTFAGEHLSNSYKWVRNEWNISMQVNLTIDILISTLLLKLQYFLYIKHDDHECKTEWQKCINIIIDIMNERFRK